MELDLILNTLELLDLCLKGIEHLKKQDSERQKQLAQFQVAIDTVEKALAQTETYIAKQSKMLKSDSIVHIDQRLEDDLSERWREASIALKEVSPSFSAVCGYKSEYWHKPGDWSKERIAAAQIRLTSIRQMIALLDLRASIKEKRTDEN